MLFEEAQRMSEHGDGWQRVRSISGRYHGVPTQRFLVVQCHLELVEIKPLPGLSRRKVVIEITGGVAKRVELAIGSQQENSRRFRVRDARIAAWFHETKRISR